MAQVLVTAVVAYTDSSARSSALALNSQVVITCSTDAWIRFGGDSVDAAASTTNNIFMAKGVPREFSIKASGQYVAAIRDSASGTMVIETWQ